MTPAHALAAQKLSVNLVRRGPATAWEIYRLSTRQDWLDHRVTDRFFSLDELERSCQSLFPGYRFDILGGPRGIGLVWDAPGDTAAWKPGPGNGNAGLARLGRRVALSFCVPADRR